MHTGKHMHARTPARTRIHTRIHTHARVRRARATCTVSQQTRRAVPFRASTQGHPSRAETPSRCRCGRGSRGRAQSRCRYGRGSQGRAQSRCRCGRTVCSRSNSACSALFRSSLSLSDALAACSSVSKLLQSQLFPLAQPHLRIILMGASARRGQCAKKCVCVFVCVCVCAWDVRVGVYAARLHFSALTRATSKASSER